MALTPQHLEILPEGFTQQILEQPLHTSINNAFNTQQRQFLIRNANF